MESRSSLSMSNNTATERPNSLQEDSSPIISNTSSTTAGTNFSTGGAQHALDFIGSSHAVKDLFSLPYVVDRPISVALHNLNGTLLIDADHDGIQYPHDGLPSSTAEKQAPIREAQSNQGKRNEGELKTEEVSTALVALSNLDLDSEALSIVHSVVEANRSTDITVPKGDTLTQSRSDSQLSNSARLPTPDDYTVQYVPPVPQPREYLSWKFRDMGLLVGSDAVIFRSPETALTVRVEEANHLKSLLRVHEELKESGRFLPDHEHNDLRKYGKPSYSDAARRTLPQRESSEVAAVSTSITDDESKTKKRDQSESFSAPNLSQVRLQTCIVPAPNSPVGGLISGDRLTNRNSTAGTTSNSSPLSPVSTVLDIYLDNIMANVPQLALCLQEKGFVQSVKVMQTEDIPSALLTSRALDTATPFDVMEFNAQAEKIFSPKIMETNASTLLRFLKTNCTRDSATYLLRREAGQTNIQLYDITTISTQRQRKWVWWLAMMSYRFSNRLRQVSESVDNPILRRNCRARQRSLLQNTLDLLEVLADMNGSKHESLVSAVCENLADTFLVSERDDSQRDSSESHSSPPQPATSVAFTKQPYGGLSVDSLNKAQDHLKKAIFALEPVLKSHVGDYEAKTGKALSFDNPLPMPNVGESERGLGSELTDESERSDSSVCREFEPVAVQLFGLYFKFVNVSLRLAEIHLRNYFSSSAMQALRASAHVLADALYVLQFLADDDGKIRVEDWLARLQLQYTWLWEHCGHFARSFAADELWRDRGHASGDDIISVLQDTEVAFARRKGRTAKYRELFNRMIRPDNPLIFKAKNFINLHSLSGVVPFAVPVGKTCKLNPGHVHGGDTHILTLARNVLAGQRVIVRDKRKVLVAASVAYHRAIQSFRDVTSLNESVNGSIFSDSDLLRLLQQRLGDACNETGKILLNEVRILLTDGSGATAKLESDQLHAVADVLLSSSHFWFLESLSAFKECEDLRNLALLRCNLCQSYKFRANAMFAPQVQTSTLSDPHGPPTHAELCLQEAARQLQAAHESMGERDVDPTTWDMVSEELAATLLVLGVRRRQSLLGSGQSVPFIAQALRLAPGKESSIVDPMERALTIYRQLGNHHQVAACHYQLALYYSKIWTCQLNESKTREKLASAFEHYGCAYSYFSNSIRGHEVTFCLLCLDFSSLYNMVAGEESTWKALKVCWNAVDAISIEAIECALKQQVNNRSEWFRQMDTLATSLEDSVFKMLRALVKLEDENGRSTPFQPGFSTISSKELYRIGLKAKMTGGSSVSAVNSGDEAIDQIASHLLSLHAILTALRGAGNNSTGR